MINLFLISDQAALKENIRSWIKSENDFKLMGAVDKDMSALRNLKDLSADIIALDMAHNDSYGLEMIKSIKDKYGSVKILILYPEGQEYSLFKVYDQGVRGFLMKEMNKEDLVLSLKKFYRDKKFICTEFAMVMLQEMVDKLTRPDQNNTSVDISKREMEVLHLISDGFTNHEIADKLFTSRRTVETHRKNLIQKTETKNTAHLIKFAAHRGIL